MERCELIVKRLGVMALLAAFLFSVADSPAEEITSPEMIRNAQQSVVNIQTDGKYILKKWPKPGFVSMYLREFYEKDTSEVIEIDYKSEGSGVFIDRSGTVLTNDHVVSGAENIRVVTSDKREYRAVIIGRSTQFDLALLKVDPTSAIIPIQFGDSNTLAAGQDVFAIGTPRGFKQSVSKGIISGVNREIRVGDEVLFKNLIQTDAAINPGNSGGPLLTLDGLMVGTMVATLRRSTGINFAIPADIILKTIPEMRENLEEIGWVNLLKDRYGLDLAEIDYQQGAPRLEVMAVDARSSAYKTGIRQGDIIEKFHESYARSLKSLINEDKKIMSGTRVRVQIQRQGRVFFTYLEAR